MASLREDLARGSNGDQLVLVSWGSGISYFEYMKNHMILSATGNVKDLLWTQDAYEEACEDCDAEVAGEEDECSE